MNLDKAKKRIAKLVKKGDHGYPQLSIAYFGSTTESATEVVVSFTLDETTAAQDQKFESKENAREDETIQSTLVKIIERTNANTVIEISGISLLK